MLDATSDFVLRREVSERFEIPGGRRVLSPTELFLKLFVRAVDGISRGVRDRRRYSAEIVVSVDVNRAEDGGGDGAEDEDEAEKRARETARVMTAVVFATVVSEGGGRVRTFAPGDDAKVGRRGVSFSQRRTLRVDVGHRFAMRPLGGVRHVVHAFTSVIALRVEHSRTVARSDDLMLTNKG